MQRKTWGLPNGLQFSVDIETTVGDEPSGWMLLSFSLRAFAREQAMDHDRDVLGLQPWLAIYLHMAVPQSQLLYCKRGTRRCLSVLLTGLSGTHKALVMMGCEDLAPTIASQGLASGFAR
jgi:hypothetical protein